AGTTHILEAHSTQVLLGKGSWEIEQSGLEASRQSLGRTRTLGKDDQRAALGELLPQGRERIASAFCTAAIDQHGVEDPRRNPTAKRGASPIVLGGDRVRLGTQVRRQRRP